MKKKNVLLEHNQIMSKTGVDPGHCPRGEGVK